MNSASWETQERQLASLATGYDTRIAGEIKNFDPLKFVDKKEARRLDPYLQYAIAERFSALVAMITASPGPAWNCRMSPRFDGS